jgi:hypothetical protein
VTRVGGVVDAPLEQVLRAVGGCQALYLGHLGVSLSGSNVTAWADQSLQGDSNRNLSQATGTRQPTISTADSQFNGRTVLSFDGGDDMASGTWSAALAQPCSWYIVSRDANNGGAYSFKIDGTGASNRHAAYNRTAGSHTAGVFSGTAEVNSAFSMLGASVVECVVLDATDAIYVNDSTAAKITGNSGAQSLTGLKLGWNQAGSAGFQWLGKIAAVVGYSAAHDAATRLRVMRALGLYYGITVT